jgi:MSHA biogenesis protein MshN
MSVINQVLNQLEQRGAHTATEQAMIRAVPRTKRSFTVPLLAFGLAFLVGFVAWQWTHARKPDVLTATVASKSGNSSSPIELEKLPLPHNAKEIALPVSGVSAENLPASRLSFELSSVPLPVNPQSFYKAQQRADSELALTKEMGTPPETPATSLKSTKSPAKLHPIKDAASDAPVAVQTSDGILPMKQVSTAQLADAEFRKAVALMQQGRIADALAGYAESLRLDAGHDAARQALVALLLEGKRGADAERVLQEGLNTKPDHTGFTMMLARLQVERGAVAEATETLEKALPYANSQADYHAFLAALLQRQNRNEEAVTHYQTALQRAPNNGVWLMGYGISLEAMHRNADAKAAFKRALDTQTLSPDLQAFVQQKLKEL